MLLKALCWNLKQGFGRNGKHPLLYHPEIEGKRADVLSVMHKSDFKVGGITETGIKVAKNYEFLWERNWKIFESGIKAG